MPLSVSSPHVLQVGGTAYDLRHVVSVSDVDIYYVRVAFEMGGRQLTETFSKSAFEGQYQASLNAAGGGGGGGGGVTSVGLAAPSTMFSVGGSPVTTAGTLSLSFVAVAQNAVWAGPTSGSGAPTYRYLVLADIPSGYSWASLSGTPTTVAGYGIVDAVAAARAVNTTQSITGGGALTTDRTLSLVGDVTTPGASAYYGTNGAGTRGWYALNPAAVGAQPLDAGLTSVAGLTGAGYVKATGTDAFTMQTGVPYADLTSVPSTFAPAAHASTHAPAGSDALPWSTIHGYGATGARPAATAANAGYLYFDTTLAKMQRSNGTTWDDVQPAGGGGSPTGSAGGDLAGTYPNPGVRKITATNKTITYDGSNRVSTISDSYGVKTIAYNGDGTVASVTGTGIYQTKTFTYSLGLLTTVTV